MSRTPIKRISPYQMGGIHLPVIPIRDLKNLFYGFHCCATCNIARTNICRSSFAVAVFENVDYSGTDVKGTCNVTAQSSFRHTIRSERCPTDSSLNPGISSSWDRLGWGIQAGTCRNVPFIFFTFSRIICSITIPSIGRAYKK
jgi:hypothetical protein